jgi:hypothetical protein
MKAPALDLMRNLGLEPDPWQVDVLETPEQRLLLNCCRQAGKSTVVALLGLAEALWVPKTLVLIVSRSLRQSTELFGKVRGFYEQFGQLIRKRLTKSELVLSNQSRIICLPCNESTIRGFSSVGLLILDEAARVPDDIYQAVRPMLAVSNGRMICLSTPRGKRGFFYKAWTRGGADWKRIEVPAGKIPRIPADFLERERRGMSDTEFRQEYECSFEMLEGVVYPDLAKCVVNCPAPGFKRRYGGIDFGYRNPFAAIWGGLDCNGVLWLTNEHYVREQIPSYHAARLPRDVNWYADPHDPGRIREFKNAGFHINAGIAAVESGIAAVQSRIRQGMLRICAGACPNLLEEAGLYRYDDAPNEKKSEQPREGYDHGLDALRYMIMGIDKHRLAKPLAGKKGDDPGAPSPEKTNTWMRWTNEALWTPMWP